MLFLQAKKKGPVVSGGALGMRCVLRLDQVLTRMQKAPFPGFFAAIVVLMIRLFTGRNLSPTRAMA
jgi:hypothetical protein